MRMLVTALLVAMLAFSQAGHAEDGEGELLKACGGDDHGSAILACSRILASNPTGELEVAALGGRASAYIGSGSYDKAIADYTRLIDDLKVRSYAHYNNRGTAYLRSGILDEAIADYEKAIELAPQVPLSRANRILALLRKNDIEEARKGLDALVAIDPDYPRVGMLRSEIDKASAGRKLAATTNLWGACLGEDTGIAVTACTELYATEDSLTVRKVALFSRAKAYLRSGDIARAKAGLAEVLSIDPKYPKTEQFRVEIERAEKTEAIKKIYADAVAKEGTSKAPAAAGESQDSLPQKVEATANVTAPAPASPLPLVIDPPGRRVALVIGNSAYRHTPALANPKSDSSDVANALKSLGFSVFLEQDLTKQGMDRAFARLARESKGAEAALFYYAGHAMQFHGVNYLMPVDAELKDEASLPFELARLDDVLAGMRGTREVRIAVLDSCRNNPLEDALKRSEALTRSAEVTRGLARIDRPEGLLVAYATQPGQVAADGTEHNSPFTAAFLRNVATPGLEVGLLFRRITGDVRKATAGRQVPELSISLEGEFYFKPVP